MTSKTQRLALGAMFVAVMMVLGYIESMIPIGALPGVKLGLSNSVLLFSLYWLGIPFSMALMLVKVLLSAVLFGNPNMMLYSLAGGLASMAAMILTIYALKGFSPIGSGAAGAVMHNVGQIGVACWQLNTVSLMYTYLPILMIAGLVTGCLTGTVAKQLLRYLPKSRRDRFFPVQKEQKEP